MVEENKTLAMIRIAENLKNEGNELFRAGSYKEAIAKYSKIFLYVNGLVSKEDTVSVYAKSNLMTEEDKKTVLELKHIANANMAAAYLSLKQYHKVIEKSRLALAIRENFKVLYRRALAFIEIGDIDGAKADLERVSQATPNDPGLLAAYKKLESKSEVILSKEKKKYKGFFDKLNDE
jgi:tetratricopeptide (TPR) repeat protein